jgi:uncharacterized protein
MDGASGEEGAWQLLEDYARRFRPDWKESMVVHAEIVLDLATFIAGLVDEDINMGTLRLGAILHDIGRTKAKQVVEHGVLGGEILRAEGFPKGVVRIAETHLGVGITREEAEKLGLGSRDLVPETLEERIVCYADNLLFYIKEEGRHELRGRKAVVERFRAELGEEYAKRAEEFMEGVEALVGDRMAELKDFIKNYNETLRTEGK